MGNLNITKLASGEELHEYRNEAGKTHRTGGPACIDYYENGKVKKKEWWIHGKAVTKEEIDSKELPKSEFLTNKKPKIIKGENKMKVTQFITKKAADLRETIKPWEKYLVAAAIIIAIDHFILGGAGREKIKELATKLSAKLGKIIDQGIDKLTGE